MPCVILAPSRIPKAKNEIKTDKRDAMKIAKYFAYNDYSTVYVPTKEDHQVKEYIRMRDVHKTALKKVKQQILAFGLRNGFHFTAGKNYWTGKHIAWLRNLQMDELLREVLDEYLLTYQASMDKIERFDVRFLP